MAFTSSKIWRFVLLACLVALLLLGLSRTGRRSAAGVMAPFSKGARSTGSFLALVWENVFHTNRLEELQETELRLRELEVRIDELDKVREENRQLRAMLKLPDVKDWRALKGELTMRDPAFWNWSFRIGLGEADGVVEGAPVMVGSYMAGRVSEVFMRSAMVSTLSNPGCAVSVYVFSGDNVYAGVLRGNGAGSGENQSAVVDFLPKGAVIVDGAKVSTSGLGTELPGGLPIGTVRGKARLVDDARMCADVSLDGDLQRVRFVTLLLRR